MFQNNGSSLDWDLWWKTLRIFTACTTCVIGWWNTWPREQLLDSFLATENRHLSHVGPRGYKSQGHRWREPKHRMNQGKHINKEAAFPFSSCATWHWRHRHICLIDVDVFRLCQKTKSEWRSWIWISLNENLWIPQEGKFIKKIEKFFNLHDIKYMENRYSPEN